MTHTVDELQDQLSNRTGGEFIQFTESKLHENVSTVHQEFSCNEDYLRAKDDEIDQMRQTLDEAQFKNRQLNGLFDF